MATRSPSPNPSRAFNTKTKTPDSSNSTRKSGSFNPSKTDFSQRSSGSKVGIASSPSLRASFEQKENETSCLKPARARSPAKAPSKGGKNFMTPTISASSKAVTASPRKRILTERNEVISVSDSLEFCASEEIAPKQSKVLFQGMERDEIGVKSEMGFGLQDSLDNMEPRKFDVVIENCHSIVAPSFSPSPAIAPLDADPSVPPYDPKTNYLSPRPRFLHYRPNPRVEQYRNRDGDFVEVGDGKRLEDSFSSESFEEVTEEEQSSGLQKSSEEESSCSEVEVEEAKDTFVPTPESNPNPHPNCFGTRSILRSKFAPLLMVFIVVACLFVPLSDSPVTGKSYTMPRDSSFAVIGTPALQVLDNFHLGEYLTGIAAVANGNIELLANRFSHWSINAVAYFTYMASLPKQEEVGLFHLANITKSAVDETFDLCYTETKPQKPSSLEASREPVIEANIEEEVEESSEKQVSEREIEMENPKGAKGIDSENEAEKVQVEASDVQDMENPEGEKGIDSEYEAEKFRMEASDVQEVDIAAVAIETMVFEDVKEANSPVSSRKEKKVEEDMMTEEKPDENTIGSDAQLDGGLDKEINMSFVTDSGVLDDQEDDCGFVSCTEIQPEAAGISPSDLNEDVQIPFDLDLQENLDIEAEDASFSMRNILGISSALAALAAGSVLFYVKQKRSSAARDVALPLKLGISSLLSVTGESVLPAEKTPFQKFPMDSEMVGNSGPSEMSSSLHSSSSFEWRRTKRAEEDENLSNERRMRRDSAASSSISYGSFTTYEKLSGKKGCRDDEVVTPVRRSSRIRKQITSP